MGEVIAKPYTGLPDHADVAYVDGKLRVASGIASRTSSPERRRRWLETVDILLDQRRALVELATTHPSASAGLAGTEGEPDE